MRIIKEPEERKREILDAADALFAQKGYDKTTISDIIDRVGVARGTVYYHFRSKEEIMDALIERCHQRMLSGARRVAEDRSVPVMERLFRTLLALHQTDVSGIYEDLHRPQNALMHQRMERLMLEGIPPVLTAIVEDGIREGLFRTPYPYEAVEMIIAHVNAVFDSGYLDDLPPEGQLSRIHAFIHHLELLLGAAPGSFEPVLTLFDGAGEPPTETERS